MLTDLLGGYTAATPGEVIDGKHVLGDLFIKADNVTVVNTWVDGNVFNTDIGAVYEPYTITDSTVGTTGTCITSPGIGWANYTATRVQIIGHDDGFRVDRPGNVTIRDSFVRLCQNVGSHSGGIQFDCPDPAVCDHVHFLHNTVVDGGGDANSSYTAQSFAGNEIGGDIVVRDSLLSGGGYVMWPWWWSTHGAANWEIHDNRVVDGSWAYAPVDANGSCAHQNWSGNSIVTIDVDYNITDTVADLPCID